MSTEKLYTIKPIKKEGNKAIGYMVVNSKTNEPERCINGIVWFSERKKYAAELASELNAKA